MNKVGMGSCRSVCLVFIFFSSVQEDLITICELSSVNSGIWRKSCLGFCSNNYLNIYNVHRMVLSIHSLIHKFIQHML